MMVKEHETKLVEEALMSVVVVKDNEAGNYLTRFIVHSEGGTVNEFTFGMDEDEAKSKTAHLVQNILLGLEYIQGQVRETYADAEDSSSVEPAEQLEEPK